ncbi:MAG: nitronate monooxygenase [Firmicutes bacterium]|nr:nitronate monooxygenase [Bacillota bacterium]
MKIPELKIGNLKAKLPIIQGGMAVRISTARLAAQVANEGAIGVIAGTGLNPQELTDEIKLARSLTDGIIGVNVLYAVKDFALLVKTAISSSIDLVISGAGFSREIFTWGRETDTAILPVVSSARLAILAERLGAKAVIVEGTEAGGHLGTDRRLVDILPEVVKKVEIPVIGAGGIIDGFDIAKILNLGASGVQMGTRFAASVESNASDAMKKSYITATKDDVISVTSPVGLPGRAIRNRFTDKINGDKVKITKCNNCLKACSHRYCIMDALLEASSFGSGAEEKALFFAGSCVDRIKEILPVKEIINNLKKELKMA